MATVAEFSTIEILPNGQRVEIRALTPANREEMLAAVGRTSTQSIYRRFFNVRRHFSEAEISFFLNPDFVRHVALVAVVEEGSKPFIAGGGRYIVIKPGQAEVAFAVIDQFQGQGIGSALLRHLSSIAREAARVLCHGDHPGGNADPLDISSFRSGNTWLRRKGALDGDDAAAFHAERA
jgi:GNAT superfamily N-acetyltransferase